MSYYVRTFTTGFGNDPRNKKFAVFHCDVCGRDEDLEIRPGVNPNLEQPRNCPDCGALGRDDRSKTLKAKIDELTKTRSKIDVQVEQLTRELSELEIKEVSNGQRIEETRRLNS